MPREEGWPLWAWLAIGVATAPLFGLTPFLSSVGWFLEALVHELGHTLAAWFLGCPAFPSLSLGGEAMTTHLEPYFALQMVVLGAAVLGAWRAFAGILPSPAPHLIAGAAGLLYLAVARTGAAESAHLLGGHLGELSIGVVFLFRGLTGVATAHSVERGLASTLGCFLIGQNVLLGFGISFSSELRADYIGSRSFGIENDYVRLAHELGMSLEGVGLGMGLVSVVALFLAVGLAQLWVFSRRAG